ncbi:hypothetical protein AB0E10_30525 [Streptomyces sp. NPDC048045]
MDAWSATIKAHTNSNAPRRLTETRRSSGTDGYFVAWEPLTHADNPR